MPDATVIGAGPAGSLVSLLLARRGWSVTIVEQSSFPRDKVCGECLSSLGSQVLARADLLQPLIDRGAISLHQVALHAGNGRSVSIKLPRPMLGISRAALDTLLLEMAKRTGVIVKQPARCEGISQQATPRVRVRDLITNQTTEWSTSRLIIADGKAASFGNRPPTTGDFGIKTHFRDVESPPNTMELFGCKGCYGGLAPVEAKRWNASFSVSAERLRQCLGDVAQLFEQLKSENSTLAHRLRRATRTGDFLASPLPRYAVRQPPSPGITLVGNGAAALEPIGGEGMGLALRSAELAAHSIAEDRSTSARRRLHDRYTALWTVRQPACRAASLIASSPKAAAIAVALLSSIPIGNAALRLVGKN